MIQSIQMKMCGKAKVFIISKDIRENISNMNENKTIKITVYFRYEK